MIEREAGSRHERSDVFGGNYVPSPLNILNRNLVAVVAVTRSVRIVNVGWPIDRRRKLDALVTAIPKDLVRRLAQIRRNNNRQILTMPRCKFLRLPYDLLDSVKCEKRLPPLQFKGDVFATRAHHHSQSTVRCVLSHVVGGTVTRLPRN